MDLNNLPHKASDHQRLLRKIESVGHLADADRRALAALPFAVKDVGANQEVVRDGDRPSHCCLLLDGMMERYKVLPEGTRQIAAFHTPGDIPDLQTLHIRTADHSLGTVSACRIGLIPHAALVTLIKERPAVAGALWRETLVDAAIFREWVVNIGARSAFARIAHLFCEVYTRLKAVGLTDNDGFTLSLTQLRIGEATGLSTVHVNRTVQELRRAGLIEFRGQFLQILDWEALRKAGGFDPAYLHIEKEALE